MKDRVKNIKAILLSIVLVGSIFVLYKGDEIKKVHAASPDDVIINEIMYNPGTGNQDDEFIELYNTTGANIDLGGWSFNAGVTLAGNTFSPGTIIPANGYLVVSPNIAQTTVTYGITAAASYAGTSLSNGGETVTLADDSSNVISTVTYDDASPWPTSPDGNGPSLELKATNLDNTDSANWASSINNGGTPLVQNSNVGLALPQISSVTDPSNVSANSPVNITATVTGSGISSVDLSYKLNFNTDVTLTMYDDGAHNDGAAGDNVYGAQIPGQPIKTLVRFKVSATNVDGTSTSPSSSDSMNYHGYYVKDPGETSNLPIIQWFIPDADYASLSNDHRFDDVYLNCVVVYGNDVYDNTKVKVRGNDSRWEQKLSLKFKLPSGYYIQPSGANRAIHEFNMIGIVKHSSLAKFTTGWWVASQTGIPVPDMVQSRLNRNGNFEGAYVYADKYESEWRSDNGYNSDELYDGPFEVLSGAPDTTRMQQFMNNLKSLDRNDPTKTDYVLDNIDIPREINFMTARAAIGQNDMSDEGNVVHHFNTSQDRWSSLPWDLDGSDWGIKPQISIYDVDTSDYTILPIQNAVYQNRDLRALYLRRLRTVVDKLYASDSLKTTFQNNQTQQLDDINLDLAKWPLALDWGSHTTYFTRMNAGVFSNNILQGIDKQKLYYQTFQRIKLGIPPSQTQAERESVSFDQVVADNNNTNEYIRLTNSADTAVDLSNWTLSGSVSYTMPAGAVVPANGVIYLLRDDINYRAAHPAVLVAGQYDTDLGSSGNLTLKTNTGDTIDTRSY